MSKDSPKVADDFCRSLELPYRLVGDERGRIIKAYGAAWPLIGLARRVSFVIGKDRRVKAVFKSERDVLGHVAQAKVALAAMGEARA